MSIEQNGNEVQKKTPIRKIWLSLYKEDYPGGINNLRFSLPVFENHKIDTIRRAADRLVKEGLLDVLRNGRDKTIYYLKRSRMEEQVGANNQPTTDQLEKSQVSYQAQA